MRITLPLLALCLGLFTFIIQPQARRIQAHNSTQKQVKTGMRVTTVHGITGKVCSVSENFIILELEDGRKIEIIRTIIAIIHHE